MRREIPFRICPLRPKKARCRIFKLKPGLWREGLKNLWTSQFRSEEVLCSCVVFLCEDTSQELKDSPLTKKSSSTIRRRICIPPESVWRVRDCSRSYFQSSVETTENRQEQNAGGFRVVQELFLFRGALFPTVWERRHSTEERSRSYSREIQTS